MGPSPSSSSTARAPKIYSVLVTLTLLVLVVGGIAWAVQYHRNWKQPPPPAGKVERPLLEFKRNVATWVAPDPNAPKDSDRNPREKEPDGNFKEFEVGMRGHYDFLFRNVSKEEVELGLETSSCDCASIVAAVVPEPDWQVAAAAQDKSPGDPLVYAPEPTWIDLPNSPTNRKTLLVKGGEFGVVRVQWNPRKAPGKELNLRPEVWWQPVGDPTARMKLPFFIPAVMTYPVRFFPPLANVGVLDSRGRNKVQVTAWSSTRDNLNLELKGPLQDPLFKIEFAPKPMSAAERADFEKTLWSNGKIRSHVLFAHVINITVYEQKDGKQLDQGVFLRKLHVFLDGQYQEEIPGPDVTGRVVGVVAVGGSDDEGKIRFKSFDSSAGATKEVMLSTTNPKLHLEPDLGKSHPRLEYNLRQDLKNSTKDRGVWRLKVIVPPNAVTGSFTQDDVVTLRIDGQIKGQAPRFVRIPIEGQVGSR